MTTYLGFEVLEVQPNRARAPRRSFKRDLLRMDSGLGKVASEDRSGVSFGELEFDWFLDGRTEIGALQTFLLARKGMAVPFWVPSWRHDLVMHLDAGSIDTSITIKASGFTKYQFRQTSRLQVAFILSNGTMIYRRITGANDPGNGTEVLTLDSALGAAIPAGTTMVCFLHLVRMASDVVEVFWHHHTLAEASMRFVEVPREIP